MKQPIERQTAATSQSRTLDRAGLPGQVVLVLQGGGAFAMTPRVSRGVTARFADG